MAGSMSTGAKIGIAAGLGLGALLVFGGTSKAAGSSPGPSAPDCSAPKDCTALIACAAPILATATSAQVKDGSLLLLRKQAQALKCDDLVKQIDKKIIELTPAPTPISGGAGTSVPFNPAKIKNLQGLINDSWTIARSGPSRPEEYGKDKLNPDGSFKTVGEFLAFDPSLVMIDVQGGTFITRNPTQIVMSLQSNAGITSDGKFFRKDGKQSETEKAWSYGLSAGSPTKIGGEAGAALCASCGSEKVSISGACCAACENEQDLIAGVYGAGMLDEFGQTSFGGPGWGKPKRTFAGLRHSSPR